MEKFKIIYEGDYYAQECYVYAIDTVKHKFLINGNGGWFKWVYTKDCRVPEEEVVNFYESEVERKQYLND